MTDAEPNLVADDQVICRAPDALFRWLLDGVLVVTPSMAAPARILGPGDLVWEALAEPTTSGAIAESLAALFGVAVETVREDVTPILRQLHEWGAVTSKDQ